MENLGLLLLFSVLTVYFSGVFLLFNEPGIKSSDEKSIFGNSLTGYYLQFISENPQFHWIGAFILYFFSLITTAYLSLGIIDNILTPHFISGNSIFLLEYIYVALFLFALSSIPSRFIFKKRLITGSEYVFFPALSLAILVYPLSRSLFYIHELLCKYLYKQEIRIRLDILNNRSFDWFLKDSPGGSVRTNFNQEIIMLQNALVFSKTRVRECMIPRTEIEAVEINSPLPEVEQKFISTGYSKLPVFDDNLDNILGYISSKDMFKNPSSVTEMLVNIAFVPETMPANRILHEFMQDHRTIAVVVDEYGGTSGIVTLEDIMEEIFGDIEDEHDTDDRIEKVVRTNEYVFSGRLEIEFLNAKYNLEIPESEEYDTLAGYILYTSHNLPKAKQVIETDKFSITMLKVSNTRIELVLFKVNTNSKA